MTTLKIGEAWTVQFPMVKHANEIGWTVLRPEEAEAMRRGTANTLFTKVLEGKLQEFNPWLTEDQARAVVESIEALPPTIEGNREVLRWLRGERQWPDENEKRHRPVQVVEFGDPNANVMHVTWEWRIQPLARKGNRADVVFVLNGIPVTIVEHKNPKDSDALERGIKQLRRYEIETPELLAQPQVYNVTHLLGYWYGVTWNATRRNIAKWKHTEDENYRTAVQAFFEPTDFLRTLKHWILFYVEDGETRKSVLREHQRKAVDKIVWRCADTEKNRGLIWHTQGSGKTFTLLTAAQQILEDKARFSNATVLLVVDRSELEGQLKDWVERLLGEMQENDIAVRRANSRQDLQDIFDSDFRGLVVSMIHKFEEIKKNSSARDNIFVFIDEAHRSVAADLGSYLMAAVPNATIIGFTGTPVGSAKDGSGSFQIFGVDDEGGYLDKYSIVDSITDETTLPIKYMLAPSSMRMRTEDLDEQFFALAEQEEITDVEELNRVLDRAVGLRAFLSADDRVKNVAEFVAKHFEENVLPLGYKAFLVAVDREACAKYKKALDRHLPPEWSEVVYSKNPNDVVDRPAVAAMQLSDEREREVRRQFKKPGQAPKILIVTDKLLTGYDAPVLYAMYLDKPMRDHVLLQAISRVNRPYIDDENVRKRVGLVVDFVGILKQLNKALQFDSDAVEGALEDLDVLMMDLQDKLAASAAEYLEVDAKVSPDAQLDELVWKRFGTPEARKKLFDDYKNIESLWEILSPSAELRDHIKTYKQLSQLYAAVRNAYSQATSFLADLEHKTRRLVEETAGQDGLGRFSKVVTFDVETLESLKSDEGPEEGKVYNLLRGLRREMGGDPAAAVVLQGLMERAERIIKNLEERKTTGLAALDDLAALAVEKGEARRRAERSGLSRVGFALYWVLEQDDKVIDAGVDPMTAAREIESVLTRFPSWRENVDEKRQLRRNLYKPLLAIGKEERARVIEHVMQVLERTA
ncbi:HsdR family type I site-specific deoxyribonuclease [Verrucosispora sp. FIM060022]|uniref:type I restriction endonuclease subunit R n=1 Tax=Verrucosispora sp. FIM060022 TaxID=1479020 RepID=UPI000F8864F7|nr:HsdR family type I site-specific deoxyribonuclease [Verrucosispora sp. FIM060022]RUL93709.1 HsdR family type I site-specific deoxyribonuclease [Verrucosispora sp. FIM060022]